MNKLLLSSAVTAVLFAGQAGAITLTNSNTSVDVTFPGQTVHEVFISGSSAATPFVEKSVAADCSGSIYKFTNGSNDFTWICDSSLTGESTVANVVHKHDAGGSITGAQSALGATTTFWDYATLGNPNGFICSGTATSNGVTVIPCTTVTPPATAPHLSDINLTDVDGAQFESIANGSVTGASGTTATPLATQIFGVVINTRLYAALQVASVAAGKLPHSCIDTNPVTLVTNPITIGTTSFTMPVDNTDACMPSLTTEQIASLAGKNRVTDWSAFNFGNSDPSLTSLTGVQALADQPRNNDIHYCSRTAGSGTLAAFNIKFENACYTGNEVIATASSATISNETSTQNGKQKVVHSMSGSGNMEDCLIGLNEGATSSSFTFPTVKFPSASAGANFRWAFGIMSLDRNSTVAKNYRYIKIDGFAPTAENVVNGKYKFWAELVNLSSPANPLTTNTLALDIMANLGSAPQITALNVQHPFGISGFLGTATNANYLPTTTTAIAPGTLINGAFDAARPVNTYSHVTAGGASLNHCRIPTIPGGTKSIPLF
jgi:hypothetical protein